MPNIELVHFTRTTPSPKPLEEAKIPASDEPLARHMGQVISGLLVTSPRLRHIQYDERVSDFPDVFERLDELQRTGSYTGTVRSIRLGKVDVPCLSILQDTFEISDKPYDPANITPLDCQAMVYMEEGEKRAKLFKINAIAEMTHLTDLAGRIVPLALLEEMRVVSGASEEDWDRRGVNPGKESFAVLLKWYRNRDVGV